MATWQERIHWPKWLPTSRWHHNGLDGVLNHQPHDCLLNRLFRRRSKRTSKLHVTGLCAGNSPWPVNSPHTWPVTRKIFPFHDVIMKLMPLITGNTDVYSTTRFWLATKAHIYSAQLALSDLMWIHHTNVHGYGERSHTMMSSFLRHIFPTHANRSWLKSQ